jgi:hypothetical protein
VGTDAGSLGVHHGRAVGEELTILVTAGYTIEAAVACSVDVGGALLDLPDGRRIAVNRPARFIAVDGPPADIPEQLSGSRYFDFTTLD